MKLTPRHRKFCEQYVNTGIAWKSYKKVFNSCKTKESYEAASSKLLSKPEIKEYIKHLQEEAAKKTEITRDKIIAEYAKMAFSSMGNYYKSWIQKKDFEKLTPDQKACIESIETRIVKKNIGTAETPEIVDVEFVKLKLFDKKGALDSLCKVLGCNAPEKNESLLKLDFDSMTDSQLDTIINKIMEKNGQD